MTMAAKPARHPAALLMQVRAIHTWIGMLIAPTVLFMAATGVLQIYSLHEDHPGYAAPPLLEELGSLHKDQVFAADHHHGPPPGVAAEGPSAMHQGPPPEEHEGPKPAVMLLKAFFTAVAAALIVSTLLGVWMALRDGPKRIRNIVLLVVGTAVPIVLAALSG